MNAAECDCRGWAVDMRVGYPNGHHPRCLEQPEPSRPVEVIVSAELLAQAFLKLPGAVILNAKMATGPVLDPGAVRFVVQLPGAPEHAVSMEPVYTSRSWPDGTHREEFLSGFTWHMADGTRVHQPLDAPHAACGVSVIGGELTDDHCRERHRGHTCNRIVHGTDGMHYCSCCYSWPITPDSEAAT